MPRCTSDKDVRRAAPASPRRRRRSAPERARIERALAEPMDYMDSPILHRRNAERLIFDEPNPVPRPSVTWYHPMVDSPAPTSQRKGLVLSREQELVLFRQYNYARLRVCRTRSRMGKQPADSVLDALLRWYDLALDRRDQIVETNLALVLAMARRVHGPASDFSDVIAEETSP